MTKIDISNLFKVLIQDLKCSIEYFKNDNFQSMNILANRIMENCMFLDECRFFLPGIMIRDISFDYQEISRNIPTTLNDAKIIGDNFLSFLLDNFSINLDDKLLWENFHKYSIKIRDFQQYEPESKIYKENLQFSNHIFEKLLEFLNKNQNKMLEIDNNFFDGIINFMVRIIRNHSCNLRNIMTYIYFQSLMGLYQYIVRKNIKNPTNFSNDIENEVFPFINYITTNFNKSDINFEEFNLKLWKIIKRMRELYLFYKPLPLPIRPPV